MAKPCEDLDDARADEMRLRALGDATAKLLIEERGDGTVDDGDTGEAHPGESRKAGGIGAACAFLCSEQAAFIRGQNLLVDGGLCALMI